METNEQSEVTSDNTAAMSTSLPNLVNALTVATSFEEKNTKKSLLELGHSDTDLLEKRRTSIGIPTAGSKWTSAPSNLDATATKKKRHAFREEKAKEKQAKADKKQKQMNVSWMDRLKLQRSENKQIIDGPSSAIRPLVESTFEDLHQAFYSALLQTTDGDDDNRDPASEARKVFLRLNDLQSLMDELMQSYDELQLKLTSAPSVDSTPTETTPQAIDIPKPTSKEKRRSFGLFKKPSSPPPEFADDSLLQPNSASAVKKFPSSPAVLPITSPKHIINFFGTEGLDPPANISPLPSTSAAKAPKSRIFRPFGKDKAKERLAVIPTSQSMQMLEAFLSDFKPEDYGGMKLSQQVSHYDKGHTPRKATLPPSDPQEERKKSIGYSRYLELIEALPEYTLRLQPQTNFAGVATQLAVLTGPDDKEKEDSYGGVVSAWTTSTYPQQKNRRMGDPICDRYVVHLEDKCVAVAVADGCNWGSKPREAAMLASNEFITFLTNQLRKQHIGPISAKTIGTILLKAFMKAHHKILEPNADPNESGTTTLLGGILLPLASDVEEEDATLAMDPTPQYIFICASVGDCKAYLYSSAQGSFREVTKGSRQVGNMNDCGGRLGPARDGAADLRNLTLSYSRARQGDILLILSDGVHDNLAPDVLGISPKDLLIDANTWDEAKALYPELTKESIVEFQLQMLNSISSMAWKGSNEYNQVKLLTDALMNHAINITYHPRRFMETNPNAAQPKDFSVYPGKMDHITCVSLRVGNLPPNPYHDLQSVLANPIARRYFEEYLGGYRYLERKEQNDVIMIERSDPLVDLEFYDAVEELNSLRIDDINVERLLELHNHFFGTKDGFESSSENLLHPFLKTKASNTLSPNRSPLSSLSSSAVPLVIFTSSELSSSYESADKTPEKTPEKGSPILTASIMEPPKLSRLGGLNSSLLCVVCGTSPCSCSRLCISSSTKREMLISLRSSLTVVQKEVTNRLEGRYFRDFTNSWWMKEGWILLSNKKLRPHYPLPPLPNALSQTRTKHRTKSSKPRREKERKKKKRDRGRERTKDTREREDETIATVMIEKVGSQEQLLGVLEEEQDEE